MSTINTKKILYIITKSNWGGAQKYVYDLATNLPQDTFEVVVACGGDGELVEKLKKNKIRTISIPRLKRDVNIFNDIFVFFFILDLLRDEQPDVLHINSSKIGGIGALAGKIYNFEEKSRFFLRKIISKYLEKINLPLEAPKTTKIIFTAHGWAFGEPRRSFLQKNIIKFLSWITILLSHKTIVVSDFDLKAVNNLPFIEKEKFLKIYNGIKKVEFVERAQARAQILGKKADEHSNKTWIGTTAELTHNKGLEYGVRAVKNIIHNNNETKQFIYIIIGTGEDKEKLSKLIKKLQLDDIVFLVGHKKNASSLLKAFDIFLLPSLKEGLPYTLLEAGLAEIPVISSNTGGIPEIIKNAKSGFLLSPTNINEISLAIQDLSENKNLAKRYKKTLKKKIESNYSLHDMLNKTIQLYE